jgi:outer membrane protein assembly factor BamB
MNSNAALVLASMASICVWLPAWTPAAVTIPDETFSSPKQLQAVLLEIHQQSYDSAVDRLQTMLEAHGTELYRTEDGEMSAVSEAFTSLSAADRAAIAGPYDARFDAAAMQMLARVRSKPDYRPQDVYAVASRFPFGKTAGTALAIAAARAADQGDLLAARNLYALASEHGYHASAAEQARITAINSTGNANADGVFGSAGPLPFDAPWYNLSSGFESDKLFPVGSGDLAFIAAEHAVLGLKPDGIVAWRSKELPQQQPSGPKFQPGSTGRGKLSVPALLADITGHAATVIACQPVPNGANGRLTALRASDGRLLWSSDSDPLLKSIAFLGSPAVAGRFVIAVGLETVAGDSRAATLQLIALDVTNGNLLWRTALASIDNNQGTHDLDLYRDQSPPAITDRDVLLSPNIGAVFSLDRFDGHIRWIHPYRQAVIGDGAIRKFVDQRHKGRDLIAPLAWTDLLRWNCTPQPAGNVVIVAPQDTVAVMGLDAVHGKLLWESGNLPQATPIGVTNGKLILSGANLTAVDVVTGLKSWTFTPTPGVRLTGPAAMRDNEILVRSTAGLLSISPADGSSKSSESTTDFHPAAASDAGKAALAGVGISNDFGVPPGK